MTGVTKGEWVIVRDADGRPESIRVKSWGDNDLMGDYRGCIIADLTASHGNRNHAIPEAEANAKLIAAAKPMYEALKRVSQYFINLQNRCALTPKEEKVWVEVSLAIKKAIE